MSSSSSSMGRRRSDEEVAMEKLKRSQEAISQIRPILQKGRWEDDDSKTFATYLCEDVAQGIEAGISSLSISNNNNQIHFEKIVGEKVKLDDYQSTRMKKPILGRIITSSPHIDGYRWRKYGNKNIKTAEYPRSYYRCAQNSCPAMKQVQQHDRQNPPNFLVMYYGNHTCNLAMLQSRHISSAPLSLLEPILPEMGSIEQNFGHEATEVQDDGHQYAVDFSMTPIVPDVMYPMWTGDVTMPDCDNSGFVSTSGACPSSELLWDWQFDPFD